MIPREDTPRYSISAVLKKRKAVRKVLQGKCEGEHLSGKAQEYLERLFAKELVPAYLRKNYDTRADFTPPSIECEEVIRKVEQAVHSIFKLFTGRVLDPKTQEELSITLAGWWSDLGQGIPFERWSGSEPTWALLYVKDIEKIPTRKGRMYNVTLRSYYGTTAGMEWTTDMAGGFIQRFIREIGCSKYEQYEDADVSGLWAIVQLDMKGSTICFLDYSTSHTVQKRNRELLKMRRQVCIGPSAFHRKHKRKCTACRYGRSECPLSRFAASHSIQKQCEAGEHRGFFRYEEDRFCISCLNTNKYRRVLYDEWNEASKKSENLST
jgi:hypothetical protein